MPSKTTWAQKLAKLGEPVVKPLDRPFAGHDVGDLMLISTPACPLTTGIFLRTVAEAALEQTHLRRGIRQAHATQRGHALVGTRGRGDR